MTRGDGGVGGRAGVPASLALAVAGVVPEGGAAPRLGYRRAGEGHTVGRRCVGELVAIDDGATLRFELPSAAVDFILLELPALPGSYCIPRLRYGPGPVEDLGRRVIAAHERAEAQASPGEVRFASDRGRPGIEIDVRGLETGGDGPVVMEVVLLRESDAVDAASRLSNRIDGIRGLQVDAAAGTELLARAVDDVRRRQDDVLAGTARLADVLAALATQIRELASAGAGRDARIDTLQACLEHARVERADAEHAATARSEAELEDARQRLQALQAEVERLANGIENVFWRRWFRRLRGVRR